jgi:hypothetical protein
VLKGRFEVGLKVESEVYLRMNFNRYGQRISEVCPGELEAKFKVVLTQI